MILSTLISAPELTSNSPILLSTLAAVILAADDASNDTLAAFIVSLKIMYPAELASASSDLVRVSGDSIVICPPELASKSPIAVLIQ